MTALGGHSAGYTEAVWLVASLIGAAVLLVLGLVYRRARTAAELEEAERIIAEHEGPDAR